MILSSMRASVCLLIVGLAPAQTPAWETLIPSKLSSAGGATVEADAEGVVRVHGKNPPMDTVVVEGTLSLTEVTGLRIEALPSPELPAKGPGRAKNGNFVLNHVKLESVSRLGGGRFRPSPLGGATATFSQGGYPATAVLNAGGRGGWAISPHFGKAHTLLVVPIERIQWNAGVRVRLTLSFGFGTQHVLGRFRVSATDAPDPATSIEPMGENWAKTQLKVNKAIDRGVEWLMQRQYLDGSFSEHVDGYPSGSTALALYAMLKSGVDKEHLAVRKAADFLRTHPPARTYSTSCQLLALLTLGKESGKKRILAMLSDLVESQHAVGTWGYPHGVPDLSNTQYAALALHVAVEKGFKIPASVWHKLAERTLKHLREGKGSYSPAGFGYRPGGAATGSMTTAGLGTLAICDAHLKRKRNSVSVSIKKGLAWMGRHFSPSSNMFGSNRWVYYYLYGAERVGGLTGEDRFGPHDWYRAGARWLVAAQKAGGAWGAGSVDTSFSLLFLSKATGSVTGGQASGTRVFGYTDKAKAVSLRASGESPLAMWIPRFGDKVLKEHAWPGEVGKGLHVEKVEYLASRHKDMRGAKVVQRAGWDPEVPHGREALAARHAFTRPGAWWLRAKVTLISPGKKPEMKRHKVVVQSDPVRVVIWNVDDEEFAAYASDAKRNLLIRGEAKARASSEFNPTWSAVRSVDGLMTRGWLSKDNDPKPKITLRLKRAVRADTLVLSHAQHRDNNRCRPTRVAIKLNGRVPAGTVDMVMDWRRKTVMTFPGPKTVTSIELTVLETNKKAKKGVGFAEVELQYRGKKRR